MECGMLCVMKFNTKCKYFSIKFAESRKIIFEKVNLSDEIGVT